MSLSSTENETASPCVPSRSVVSKVKIFITDLLDAGGGFLRYAGLLFLLEERHHFAELPAHLFDRLVGGGFAHGEEFLAARFVFRHPILGELAGLDLFEDFLHFG